jgi:putative ABC transport system permease protein
MTVSVTGGVKLAIRALQVNLMRSALAMLGIVIGVAAFVTMVAVGAGAQAKIAEQIRSLGSNLIVVLSGTVTSGGVRLGAGTQLTLTEDDARALEREVAGIHAAAPTMRGAGQLVYGNVNWSTVVQGATPEYMEAREWRIAFGKGIAQEDVDGAAKVIVLGDTVTQTLFGDVNPVGQTIRLKKVPFTVVGVLERKGQSLWGQDQDDIVMIPLSTAKKRVLGVSQANARSVGAILVKVRDASLMKTVEEEARDLLRQRHRLLDHQDDDFQIRNLAEVVGTQESASRVLTLLLAAVASVSLIVGGIGIMNIMLVSVTERTREIGLRMAVGARQRDILTQFLLEAVTLSGIGGGVGVLVGIIASYAVAQAAGWPALIRADAIALAVLFAAAIGVFFGFYPAKKAADLNPIEALRYE